MNQNNIELYNNLLYLTKNNDAFYFVDHVIGSTKMRIFAYRLASYTDWLSLDALEARGIMFELDANDNCIRLVARPPRKFFNIGENPFTMNLDFTKVTEVQHKMDGSLMSTFIWNNKLYLKSKTSLSSEHCKAAMRWLEQYLSDYELLYELTKSGYTVNLEWCSPESPFRIVIGYVVPQLYVLNARHIETGDYLSNLESINFGELQLAPKVDVDINNIEQFIQETSASTGIEGYIFKFSDGLWVKHKSLWYCNLHYNKDSVNNPRRLFECVVNETSDDLRTMFFDDPVALQMINDMERKVSKIYNHMVNTVESFYETNKGLDRKGYAILGRETFDPLFFGLAMNKYIGRETNWKEFMIKNYREFDIKDETIIPVE